MDLAETQQPILENTSVHGQLPPNLFSSKYGLTGGKSRKPHSDKKLKKTWRKIMRQLKKSRSKGGSWSKKVSSKTRKQKK